MFRSALLKHHAALSGRVRGRDGFSLIELLIAMAVLLLIVFAFTPLFLSSMEGIILAGDKSEALYEGQEDMEIRIVEKDTIDGYEVVFDFTDTTVTVPGGLIDVEHSEGKARAWLSTFLPYVPSIQLSAVFLAEGYTGGWDGLPLVIMGRSTKLAQADYVYIYTSEKYAAGDLEEYRLNFEMLDAPPEGVASGFDEYAAFNLPLGLLNAESPYIIEMKWDEGEVEIKVRARLHIMLPFIAVAGDNGETIESPDASLTWSRREPGIANRRINDIIWADFKYIAVADNGDVIIWEDEHEPRTVSIPGFSADLYGVAYGNGKLVAVGENGVIALSENGGESWSLREWTWGQNLYAVDYNDSEFMAVGARGKILTSTDGRSWREVETAGIYDSYLVTFYGLAYGNGAWVVAGGAQPAIPAAPKAVIYRQDDDGYGWDLVYEGSGNTSIRDVCYNDTDDGDKQMFVAVGNGGTILTSTEGFTWWPEAYVTGNHLNRVVWDGTWEFQNVIAGDKGTVITGTAGAWQVQTTNSARHLRGVAVRWAD